MTKLATSKVSGSSRWSPQASDQQRKISARKGNSAAAGFHTSWKDSAASDWHISAIPAAAANISTSPPRRRASTTQAMIASALIAPIVTARLAVEPKRAGSASSQYSSGPGLWTIWPVTLPASEYWPTSGECDVSTSQARVTMMPSSAAGCQPSLTACTVETITGIAAARPAAMAGSARASATAVRRSHRPSASAVTPSAERTAAAGWCGAEPRPPGGAALPRRALAVP